MNEEDHLVEIGKVAVQLQSCHHALRALVSANLTGDPRELATALAHAKEWLGSRP